MAGRFLTLAEASAAIMIASAAPSTLVSVASSVSAIRDRMSSALSSSA